MADADAATTLALSDGRVQLTIENRDLGAAVIEHLSVDWPGVATLPEDGRPNGLRRRRGRLRAANLLVDGKRLQSIAAGIALPETLTRMRLVFEKGRIVVAGAVAAAGAASAAAASSAKTRRRMSRQRGGGRRGCTGV